MVLPLRLGRGGLGLRRGFQVLRFRWVVRLGRSFFRYMSSVRLQFLRYVCYFRLEWVLTFRLRTRLLILVRSRGRGSHGVSCLCCASYFRLVLGWHLRGCDFCVLLWVHLLRCGSCARRFYGETCISYGRLAHQIPLYNRDRLCCAVLQNFILLDGERDLHLGWCALFRLLVPHQRCGQVSLP